MNTTREITGYRIIDVKTQQQIGGIYTYAMRNRARSRADRLDRDYGAVRYVVQPIFSEVAA